MTTRAVMESMRTRAHSADAGRGNPKIPFQDNEIQADLPETRRDRQPSWAGTDDDNVSGFCQ
jgi:hypothetical protein